MFEDLIEQEQEETVFDELVTQEETAIPKPALNSTTLITALARIDSSKDPELQLGREAIESARQLLDLGEEKTLRYQIAGQRQQRLLSSLAKLRSNLGPLASQEDVSAVSQAYQTVLNTDYEQRARHSLEEEAFEKIQDMAARDPVQARVLLDNLEHGDANQTIQSFWTKMTILNQRAEELEQEWNNTGWGKAILNFVLNVVPTNYNFARSGIVEPSDTGLAEWFRIGENLRRQSETLWSMPMEEFAEFTKPDGELMRNIRENATTLFDVTSDPLTAVHIIHALTNQTDSDRWWANLWGIAEPAMFLPVGRITSATKSLLRAGGSREAVRNLDNAVRILDDEGADAMRARTGVTEAELIEETSMSAVNPARSPNAVPLAEQLETRIIAAERALREILDPPKGERFRTVDEIKAAYTAAEEHLATLLGRPIKDVRYEIDDLVGGGSVRYVTVTFGKKDGHGFATENTALNAARTSGLGEFEAVQDTSVIISEAIRNAPTPKRPSVIRAVTPSKEGNKAKELNLEQDFTLRGVVGEKRYSELEEIFFRQKAELTAFEQRNQGKLDDLWDDIIQNEVDDVIRRGEWSVLRATENPANPQTRLAQEAAPPPPPANDLEPLRDISGQWFVRARVNVPEQGFFTNELHAPTQGFLSKLFGRYARATSRISDIELHGRSLAAGSAINRAHKIIEKNIISELRHLNSNDAVRQILLKGATLERWWTPEEFKTLMQRGFGREATEKELEGYQKLILFNDMEWKLRNDMIYMDRVIKGYESVRLELPWGQLLDEDVLIRYSPDVVPTERVWNMTDNVHYTRQNNPLTPQELDRLRNNGYVMVEFPNGLNLPQGIVVNRMLVRQSDLTISPLRKNQLAYAEGGHRMYTDRYFVKQGKEGVQSDTGSKYLKSPNTFITAPNKVEAARWANTMDRARLLVKDNGADAQRLNDEVFFGSNAFPTGEEFLRSIDDGLINLNHPFEAVFNRELPSMYQKSGDDITRFFNDDELGINGYYRTTGRMYTSSKGAHLKDHTGNLAVTVDPYEALTTSLRQVTRASSLFHYKTEALERFQNTYRAFLDVQPNHRYPSQVLTEAKVRPDVPAEIREQIEAQRNAILNVLRYETPLDKKRAEFYRSTAEWVLGTGDNAARRWAHDSVFWWKDRNPVSFLRGLAFDAKLGMFNLGQFFIQTSTMIAATSMSPRYGMRGMMGLFPMHGYLLSRGSENVLDTLAKRGVGRTMGFKTADEFKEYARHVYASGFTDMNGSHIMINDYGPTAHFGSFADRANHVRENARVFFYTAETYNRLVSYRIAWGEAHDMGLRLGDPQFNSTILRLADDYSMNMTTESAAWWQKGLLSIPTQFWAYNVRMMDAMFGSRFSRGGEAIPRLLTLHKSQRFRLMLANIGMAGALGIPGLSVLSEYLKDKNGESPSIDSLNGVADRGLIDYLHYQVSGADVLIGEKLGTGAWLPETIRAIFGTSEYGERSFVDILGGATYSIGKSTATAGWETIRHIQQYAAAESGSDLGEQAMAGEAFLKMMKEISTFGNASKAILVQQYGIYKSKSGTILADDLPAVDSVYVALGFRPAPTEEIGHMMDYLEDQENTVKEVATQLRNWRQEAFSNPDKFEENMRKSNALIRLLPARDRREVLIRTNRVTDDSLYDNLSRKVEEERLRNGETR